MKRRLLGRTGTSCMTLAMLFMMSGGVSIHVNEVSTKTPLTVQERAVPAASLDTTALKNVDTTLKTEADGELTLTVKAKGRYYFTDGPLARSGNSNVTIRRKSGSIAMVYSYDVSVCGDVTDSCMISVKEEAVVLTSPKLILNTDNLKDATAILEKNEGITPLDNVILTLNAGEKAAFESVSYTVIDGEKRAMRSFADEKTMYALSIMDTHKDTTIEVYSATTSTEARGILDRIKVIGYVNEGITSYNTVTLTNAIFHKLVEGSDISSWFYSLPKEMQVIAADGVAKGDMRIQIKFCGKPTELSNVSIDIIIEDRYIANSNNGILKVDLAGNTWLIQTRTEAPVIMRGNQAYIMGSNKPLELIYSGELRDLYGIFISGSVLSSDYYTLTSGNTVLALKPECPDALEKGSYTIRFTCHDGGYAEIKFAIGDKKQEASTQTNQEGVPSTADATSAGLLLVTLLTSGTGMAAVSVKKKRARQ